MPDLGPAGLIIIGFLTAISGLIGVYGATGFAVREPVQRSSR